MKKKTEHADQWLEYGIDVPGKTFCLKGSVDDDMLDTCTSAIHMMGSKTDINIILHSYGGDTWAGMAIYDLLSNHEGIITMKVAGVAASMAFVILQAADVRQATKHSVFMHHVGEGGLPDNHPRNNKNLYEFQKKHDNLVDYAVLNRINQTLVSRGQKQLTLKMWKNLDTWDNWMIAEDALKMGALDKIV